MSRPSSAPVGRALAGVLLALVGSVTVTVIAMLAYGQPTGHEMVLINLGIPLTLLLSAAGQLAVVIGLALLWSAVHHGR